MTALAGIFSKRPDRPLPDSGIAVIRNHLCRNPRFRAKEYAGNGFFVAVMDVGAFAGPGVTADANSLTAVVGDPVVAGMDEVRRFAGRTADVAWLRGEFAGDRWNSLTQAQGSFAGVHIDATTRTLAAFTDKVGMRPLFVAETADHVYFANSLRILELLPELPRSLDTTSIVQELTLSSMGRRSPYVEIDLIPPAEVYVFRGGERSMRRYWNWPKAVARISEAEALEESDRLFTAAVKARVESDREVVSFVSGGMDSRAIVARLRTLGISVAGVNFAPPATQDLVFAKTFADAAGCKYLQMPYDDRIVDTSRITHTVAEFVDAKVASGEISPDRPRMIWSGNGGSVGLGHITLTDSVTAKLRAKRTDEALQEYLTIDGQMVPRRPFRASFHARYRGVPIASYKEELAKHEIDDEGRKLWIVLMENDQHRSLLSVFEQIDLHGLEFAMPFYDGRYVEFIAALPLEDCLFHRFYAKWFPRLGAAANGTPWQTYPNHVPCPIPYPRENLAYQFGHYSKLRDQAIRRRRLKRAREMLTSKRFPHDVVSYPAILGAAALCYAGVSRVGYWIDKGYGYFRYAVHAAAPRD
jgi:asparagine synthase (glutamine-hydrolysing)